MKGSDLVWTTWKPQPESFQTSFQSTTISSLNSKGLHRCTTISQSSKATLEGARDWHHLLNHYVQPTILPHWYWWKCLGNDSDILLILNLKEIINLWLKDINPKKGFPDKVIGVFRFKITIFRCKNKTGMCFVLFFKIHLHICQEKQYPTYSNAGHGRKKQLWHTYMIAKKQTLAHCSDKLACCSVCICCDVIKICMQCA